MNSLKNFQVRGETFARALAQVDLGQIHPPKSDFFSVKGKEATKRQRR